MKQLKFLLLLCGLMWCIVGCEQEGEEASQTAEITYQPSITMTPGFQFAAALNIFQGNSDAYIPLEGALNIEEEGLVPLKLYLSVEPDDSQGTEDVPVKLWVFEDGMPVEFAVDGMEKQEEQLVYVKSYADNFVDIKIPVSKDVQMITVTSVFFPGDVPDRGLGQYSGELSYTIINYGAVDRARNVLEGTYVEVENKEENYGLDIGVNAITKTECMVNESHFHNDVVVMEGEPVYVKFNSGPCDGMKYYLLLFVDGELVPLAEDSFALYADCLEGERAMMYQIPGELLSEPKLYIVQAVAIPACPGSQFTAISSYKVRVQIQ